MKTVTRIDSLNEKERNDINRQHQERLQESLGMIKLNGRLMREFSVNVSKDDLDAFRKYRSEILNTSSKHMLGMDVINDMIARREELEELTISESDILSPLTIRIDPELYEMLSREAAGYKISLNDYMRAIIFGHGKAADKRNFEKTKQSLWATKYHLPIHVPYSINPETRERLYKKHGRMSDDQLVKLAQQLITEALNK